jgi:hypothetical protein
MLKRLALAALAAVFFLSVAAACGNKPKAEEHAHYRAPNGDLQEKTASIETLPSFLDNQREEIRTAYKLAAAHAGLLDSIPCYCGCGGSAGHRSNKNCFIREIADEGTVVWDDHGTRCAVCIETALAAAMMNGQGKSVRDIRAAIDEAYKEGYAKPTPTPMP